MRKQDRDARERHWNGTRSGAPPPFRVPTGLADGFGRKSYPTCPEGKDSPQLWVPRSYTSVQD